MWLVYFIDLFFSIYCILIYAKLYKSFTHIRGIDVWRYLKTPAVQTKLIHLKFLECIFWQRSLDLNLKKYISITHWREPVYELLFFIFASYFKNEDFHYMCIECVRY